MSECTCEPVSGERCICHLRRLEEKVDKVLAISERVEGIVVTVASQVKPVLDDLMKSPLLKMLGVKSK